MKDMLERRRTLETCLLTDRDEFANTGYFLLRDRAYQSKSALTTGFMT
jgi:hypothetical protein